MKYGIGFFCALLTLLAGVSIGIVLRGYSVSEVLGAMKSKCNKKTVEDRLEEIERKHPEFVQRAKNIQGQLSILVFKQERQVELWANGWETPCTYSMTEYSGKLGPKLKEGDGQIPEGVYGIEYLNPNSLFHLSIKVSYPGPFDREMARREGRENLGGDIMIHGGAATVGCIPIGDDKIEEVFYYVGKIGLDKVKIIISPYDMRKGRIRELEQIGIVWYPSLCDRIERELRNDGLE